MSIVKLAAVTAAAVVVWGTASAETLGIGTTQGGATGQIASTLSKLVSTKSEYQMRADTMSGTQQYIPIVDAGELHFGLSNLPQYWMAKQGTGLSDRKHENLVLLANLMPFSVAPMVADKSSIRSVADLKGKDIPYGFKSSSLFAFIAEAFLANGGLTYDDVKRIPVTGLPQHWDLFKQGKIDFAIAAVGTAAISEMNASIPGGVRFVSLDPSDEAFKRLDRIYPKSFLKQLEPGPNLVGVKEPVYTLFYDYMIFTHTKVADQIAYTVAKTIHQNEAELKASGPLWRAFNAAEMGKDEGTPYHPGAVKYYKEAGLVK